MNLILLEQDERDQDIITLTGRRAEHILKVLRPTTKSTLRVGYTEGQVGESQILKLSEKTVTISKPTNLKAPPAPWFDLLLAVPRPKVLHRIFAPLASMGLRRLVLINAAKVERCYFDTHYIKEISYLPLLREGLEQAGTTAMPEVIVRQSFKPFVEDELGDIFPTRTRLLAHPRLGLTTPLTPFSQNPPTTTNLPLIAIGPEGGWTQFEIDLLLKHNFTPLTIGDRALRTDIACYSIIGALAGAYTTELRG